MTIRNRLTFLYTALLAATLLFFSTGVYAFLHYSLYQQVDRELRTRATEIQASLLQASAKQQTASLEGIALPINRANLMQNPDVFFEVSDQEGKVHVRSANLGDGGVMSGDVTPGLAGQTLATYSIDGQAVRILSLPVTLPNQPPFVLRVGQPLAPISQTLERLTVTLTIGTILAAGAAYLLGLVAAGQALLPIAAMTARAQDIVEHQRLDTRLPVINPGDELGRMALVFNDALAQIEQLFQTQRRFVADAAHELRTPLTSIRGYVGLLQRGAMQDAEGRDEALTVIDRESARLSRLVNDLLTIAQSEANTLQIVKEPVSLLEVVTQAARQVRQLAVGYEWVVRPKTMPIIMGDTDRLHQICLNLMDNARRHTPEGTRIIVTLDQDQRYAIFAVSDNGPGIPPDLLPNIFEPFFRADQARDRNSTGLGLAIVQRLVLAHGGRIQAGNNPDGGAKFTVLLPLADAKLQS